MKNKASILVFLLIAVGGAVALFIVPPGHRHVQRKSDRPNVLLICLDTTRADHLSCYGYDRATTPRLDALAAEGLRYTRCVAASSRALPAHASLMTGLFPTSHGAGHPEKALVRSAATRGTEGVGLFVKPLADEFDTLAEVLKRHGFATGAFVGGPWHRRQFGLSQGFEVYNEDPMTNANGRLAEQINRQAFEWIDTVRAEPFFLFINYFDPHQPYLAPERFRHRFTDESKLAGGASSGRDQVIALYDAEIFYVDFHLGRLVDRLKRLGLYDDTWIIVTAGHGELLGEHGLRGHGTTLYQEELQVPLIMKYPKKWARYGRSDVRIQTTDIMPIVLDQLEMDLPPRLRSRYLPAPALNALAELHPPASLSKRGALRAFYVDDLKFIWNSRGHHEFYDLSNDPNEATNLYRTRYSKASAIRDKLDALMKSLPRPPKSASAIRSGGEATIGTPRGLADGPEPSAHSPPIVIGDAATSR